MRPTLLVSAGPRFPAWLSISLMWSFDLIHSAGEAGRLNGLTDGWLTNVVALRLLRQQAAAGVPETQSSNCNEESLRVVYFFSFELCTS